MAFRIVLHAEGAGETQGDTLRLRRLLRWPSASRRPDLAIVLVDADGDLSRKAAIAKHVEGIPLPTVVTVAVQEFESWLLCDQATLNRVSGAATPKPPAIEQLKPGHAKEMLAACLAVRADAHAARREIAQTLDMDQLGRESSSFALFVADMRPAPG